MIDLNQVNIIENLIPKHYEDYLYKTYTTKSNWYLNSLFYNTSFNKKEIRDKYISPTNHIYNNLQEGFQFQSYTLKDPNTPLNSPSPIYLLHYLQMFLDYKFEIIPKRIKTNLKTIIPSSKKESYNTPHIDLESDSPLDLYFTLIYYINDSDGDTLIYNEKYNGTPIEKFTVNKRVSPKKGLSILFPYNTFHSGSHPTTTDARIVINYNFQLIPL